MWFDGIDMYSCPYYIIRSVLVTVYCVIVMLFFLFRKKLKRKRFEYGVIIGGALLILIFIFDSLGQPVENIVGFPSIEAACRYSANARPVAAIEGGDSTLIVAEVKATDIPSHGTIAVYTKGFNGWNIIVPKSKKKQILVKEDINAYSIYLLNAEKSSDYYLVVFDARGDASVYSTDTSVFNHYQEEGGSVYWFAHYNAPSSNEEIHIEIRDKNDDVKKLTIQIPNQS